VAFSAVEQGVFDFPLSIPPALEGERPALRAAVRDAQRRIVRFAATYGWARLVEEPFATEARIFDRKADFDRDAIALTGSEPATLLPKTFSAGLERGVLIAVSPALYAANFPEGARDPAGYEKLLAHEIAHRLHVRILDGHEDDMGPIWFFEGFAVYAAGQWAEDAWDPEPELLDSVLRSSRRGSYRDYGKVFRFFARRVPLRDLIGQAAKPRFAEWARATAELP